MPSTEVVTNKVVVHPLVLLSVVDHFNRMDKIGHQKRVVGVLLGSWREPGHIKGVAEACFWKVATALGYH